MQQLTKLSVFLREKFPILVNVSCICFRKHVKSYRLCVHKHLQVKREQTCHLHHSDPHVSSSSPSSSSAVPQCAPPLVVVQVIGSQMRLQCAGTLTPAPAEPSTCGSPLRTDC